MYSFEYSISVLKLYHQHESYRNTFHMRLTLETNLKPFSIPRHRLQFSAAETSGNPFESNDVNVNS